MAGGRVALVVSALAALKCNAQSDGNPHHWDRKRRCDHTDYHPKCGPCEGIGGYVSSDKASDAVIPSCSVVKTDQPGKRPVWGDDFTESKSHEILIGKKHDPACFQAFPGNESTGTNCYKPQECFMVVDFKDKMAVRIHANQGGNAWGIFGNVSSVIYHQGKNMWITNHLPLGVTQTICTIPREGGDPAKPGMYPVQYNWVDNLFFVSTETIDVEYGVGPRTMDHWAFGPHHAWTEPTTGIIIRMWQPFNGLQIFQPGTFKPGHDASLLAELAADGSKAPKAAVKGGSTFRIKCQDDGFPEGAPVFPRRRAAQGHKVQDENYSHATTPKATEGDLQRAKTKVPRGSFRGDGFEHMSTVLNAHLHRSMPSVKECEEWAVEELQQFQVLMMALRDPNLDDIYHTTSDNRRLLRGVKELQAEWKELNSLAKHDPDLARMHRDGHCHEAVMWYVHHLSHEAREALKSKITLPLLSYRPHVALRADNSTTRVHRSYEEKVTCFSCHSNILPTTSKPKDPSILV